MMCLFLLCGNVNQPHVYIYPLFLRFSSHWGHHEHWVEFPNLYSRLSLVIYSPDAGKHWGQEDKGTEDEMVGWHHWLNGHEFEQTPGDSEGQGSQACTVHGVTKSWTRLSNWTITVHSIDSVYLSIPLVSIVYTCQSPSPNSSILPFPCLVFICLLSTPLCEINLTIITPPCNIHLNLHPNLSFNLSASNRCWAPCTSFAMMDCFFYSPFHRFIDSLRLKPWYHLLAQFRAPLRMVQPQVPSLLPVSLSAPQLKHTMRFSFPSVSGTKRFLFLLASAVHYGLAYVYVCTCL